jgi:hypothetical protein
MTTRTVTGLYDSYDAAAQTVRDLEAVRIPDSDISYSCPQIRLQ